MAVVLTGKIEPVGPRLDQPLWIGPPDGQPKISLSCIVDTAASKTQILPAALNAAGLSPVGGEGEIHKPDGTVIKGTKYVVSLWTAGRVCLFPRLEVIATRPIQCTALIGQDILARCLMVHDGPAQTARLSFPDTNE
jgi:hypothetical protein